MSSFVWSEYINNGLLARMKFFRFPWQMQKKRNMMLMMRIIIFLKHTIYKIKSNGFKSVVVALTFRSHLTSWQGNSWENGFASSNIYCTTFTFYYRVFFGKIQNSIHLRNFPLNYNQKSTIKTDQPSTYRIAINCYTFRYSKSYLT